MTEKYRIKFYSVDNPDEDAFVRGDDGNAVEFSETEAQTFAEEQNDTWAGVFAFQVVPPHAAPNTETDPGTPPHD